MSRTVRWMGAAWLALALLMAPGPAQAREPARRLTGVVNLNHATAQELDLLPGVGEKAAKLIIAYRARQAFKRIEDLVRVKGFGKKRFEKMRPYLTVSGPTTLQVERTAQARASPR